MPDPVMPSPTVVDRHALLRTLGALHASPTAKTLLDRALESGVTIRTMDDATMDRELGQGLLGSYEPEDHSITLRQSLLATNPEQALQTTAHELVHAVDRRLPQHAELVQTLDAAYLGAGLVDPSLRTVQVNYHASVMRESRAYVAQAQVRRELGIPAKSSFHRSIEQAPNEAAAYDAAWQHLETRLRLDQPVTWRDVPVTTLPGSTLQDPV